MLTHSRAHKEAHRLLAEQLANYQGVLVPDLETILSAKTVVTAQAEETSDLAKLDQLSIRIRSLEIRERVASAKAEESEKWFQKTLPLHVERDERLGAYWEEKLLTAAVSELRAHFAIRSPEVEAMLEELAPKTTKYLEGKIKVPLYSYGWAQPLEPFSQKVLAPGARARGHRKDASFHSQRHTGG
jgi:hypothetical protein